MKIMGRVVSQSMKSALVVVKHLRAAGYETYVCWNVINVHTGEVYMEFFKDFPSSAFIEAHKDGTLCAIIEKVDEIVGPSGNCIEAGQVPDDYMPHSEDDSESFKFFERL
jgi:hypothetical protein